MINLAQDRDKELKPWTNYVFCGRKKTENIFRTTTLDWYPNDYKQP